MGDRQSQDDRATRIRTIIGQKHQPEQHRANIEQKYREGIEQNVEQKYRAKHRAKIPSKTSSKNIERKHI
jgi:hypothetical protein